MQGVFVTGTGTGVGKSIVAAALCAALVDARRPVVASKPVLSGLEEPPGVWPYDHDLLALVTGQPADAIAPRRFGPAVSPHLAARLAHVRLTVDDLVGDVHARVAAATGDASNVGGQPAPAAHQGDLGPLAIVEGAGGLLVPLDDDGATMADLAVALGLPLVIAAHPGLGTINHVQLTLEAARSRGLTVAGVVLTPWPTQPSLIEQDNREFLEKSTGLPILGLGTVESPRADHLAAAGLAAGLTDLC
ncbi:MAG: ATP-dependent dethiobiotin synthetase BioD [Solirubrobacteraceae bacterium]|nr:ATP-dependent dethiobiotin synthetase BioD [Patulibacter sp.]